MNSIKLAAIAAAVIAMISVSIATAHEEKHGDVTIHHPWARASATSQAKTGAVYLKLENHGNSDVTLTGVSTDASKRAELHTHIMTDDGVMQMREVEGGINVPAHGAADLKPGGLHIMLMGLIAPLGEGEVFDITLTFSDGSEGTFPVEVMGVAAGGAHGESHEGHDDEGSHDGNDHSH